MFGIFCILWTLSVSPGVYFSPLLYFNLFYSSFIHYFLTIPYPSSTLSTHKPALSLQIYSSLFLFRNKQVSQGNQLNMA